MSAADDAATLVAMPVADLAAHLEGTDLETLSTALALEEAREGGARKGAVAALTAAIEGHPENAVQAAADAEAPALLNDKPADPNAVSVAPARPHQSLVDQFELRWGELLNFARPLEGEIEGALGDVLTFVRSKF